MIVIRLAGSAGAVGVAGLTTVWWTGLRFSFIFVCWTDVDEEEACDTWKKLDIFNKKSKERIKSNPETLTSAVIKKNYLIKDFNKKIIKKNYQTYRLYSD